MKFSSRLLPLAILAAVPVKAYACAVCFGKSDAPLAQGMNMGILTLLAFVVVMWVGFGALFVYFARRSSAVASASQANSQVVDGTSISSPK